jgi:hypothetical protein
MKSLWHLTRIHFMVLCLSNVWSSVNNCLDWNEASFTFTTCTALALCTVGKKETWSGHMLFFTWAPNNGTAGNCQTAPIAGKVPVGSNVGFKQRMVEKGANFNKRKAFGEMLC